MMEQGAARLQRAWQVECREAQRPTSLGACAPQRSPRVTGNGRGRTAGFAKPAKGRFASALAPPQVGFTRLAH